MNKKGIVKVSSIITLLLILTMVITGCKVKSLHKRAFDQVSITFAGDDDANNVNDNIILPMELKPERAVVEWSSSDENVISIEGGVGVVHGQKEPTAVTITITVTIDGKSQTKDFELIVTKEQDLLSVKFLDHDGRVIKEEKVKVGEDATAPKNPTRVGHTFIKWDKEYSNVESNLIVNAVYKRYSYQITFYDDDLITILEQYILPYGDMPMPSSPVKEGYKFIGWDKDLTGATESKSYYARYEKLVGESFTVTFLNEDNSVYKTINFTDGQIIYFPTENPTKVGYSFVGWELDGELLGIGEKVNSNLTLTPRFTASLVNYTVEYHLETLDEELLYELYGEIDVLKAEADSKITITKLPSFAGFILKEGQEMTFTVLADGSLVIKIYYNRLTYKVSFGEYADEQIVKHGGKVVKPNNPIKENYVFVGWFVNGIEFDFELSEVKGNIDLIARFDLETFNITFVNGEQSTTIKVEYGTMPTIENPTKEETKEYRYEFTAWTPEVVVATKDATYKAVFEEIAKEYTLTWIVDGIETKVVYKFGADIIELTGMTKEGHTFKEWDKEVPLTMPASNLEIEALWNIKSFKVSFYVEDQLAFEKDINYNELVPKPDDPVVEGKEFTGWFINGSEFDFESSRVKEDFDLIARFDLETFNITFVNGEQSTTIKVEHGTMPTIENPTKEETNEYRYEFTAWTPEVVVATKDATYKAVFEEIAKEYTLTWIVDGIKTKVIYKFGADVIELTGMTKEGHTFKEWDKEVPLTMPASNLEIEALWTLNTYTVTYLVDGEQYIVKTYDFGESISLIDEPTKEGYTFNGWVETLPSKMPASNLIINGSYTINQYIVSFVDFDDSENTFLVDYQKLVSRPENPTREGYIFVGWLLGEELYEFDIPVTKHIQLVASYRENILPIITAQKDLIEIERLKTVEDYITLFGIEASRDGESIGFSIDSIDVNFNVSGLYDVIVTVTDSDDNVVTKTLKVKVVPIVYNIIFDTKGDTTIRCQEVAEGTKISKPRTPFKDGYQFIGWLLDEEIYDFDSILPLYVLGDKTITLEGSWEKVEETYQVVIYIDDENIIEKTYSYGQLITKPATPINEGYILTGWLVEKTKVEWNFEYDGVTEDVILIPKWTKASEIEKLLANEVDSKKLIYYQEFEDIAVFLIEDDETGKNSLFVKIENTFLPLRNYSDGEEIIDLFAVSLMSPGLPKLLIKTSSGSIHAGTIEVGFDEVEGGYKLTFSSSELTINFANDEDIIYAKLDEDGFATLITSKQRVYVVDASGKETELREITNEFMLDEDEEFVVSLNHRELEFNNLLRTNKDRYFLPGKYTNKTYNEYYIEITDRIEEAARGKVLLVESMFQIITVIDEYLNRYSIIILNKDEALVTSEYSDVIFLEGEEIVAYSETYLISNLNRVFYIKPDQDEDLYEIEIMANAFDPSENILNIYSGKSMTIVETSLNGGKKYYILENMAFNNIILDVSVEINEITEGSAIVASYNGMSYIIITESGVGLVVR